MTIPRRLPHLMHFTSPFLTGRLSSTNPTAGRLGAVRRVVEPLGYLINVTEWWETNDPPGTFRLDIGVLETGITEEMFYEMERLIADAKPASRHLIGLNIIQDIPGYLYTGALTYDGDIITVYPG